MRARKRFGQHFLEPAWVEKLLDAFEPAPSDRAIEIGPGRGALTVPLARRLAQVVAVEIDRDLASALARQALPNVTVVTADVLEIDLAALARDHLHASPAAAVRIIGNLPYNISSPILVRLLDAGRTGLIRDATLMLQKEVADRLAARPGTGEYGGLTLVTALDAEVTRLLALPPGAFRPMPKVHSVVVRLTFRPPPVALVHRDVFVGLVRSMFTQRRKTLANALKAFAVRRGVDAGAVLRSAGLDPSRRPDTLELAEAARLADAIAAEPERA